MRLAKQIQKQKEIAPQQNSIQKIVTFAGGGFDFLGFHFSHNGVTMRAKSVERLKEKIKKLTIRSHNFSHDAVQDLDRVIRGVANYYATDFSFPEPPLSPYRASSIFLT